MFTRCPACQTLFRITAEALRAAGGQVRCGRCGTQFDALQHLLEAAAIAEESGGGPADQPLEAPSLPPGDDGLVTTEHSETVGAAGGPLAGDPASEEESERTSEGESAVRAEPVTLGLDRAVLEAALLTEAPERRGTGRRIVSVFTLLVLLAVFGLQWVYMQRVPLYERQPALRPLLQWMCAGLQCGLPLPRAPGRIEVLTRQVREHPRVAKALLVDLAFVSRADQVIAYPVLELQLSDLSGNRVAGRRFAPREYLPAGIDRDTGLRPNVTQHVTLELVQPSAKIVSFQFEFL